jgi:apolipoprotein N-acyltransferase
MAEHLARHLALSREAGFDRMTAVIWPETAAPPLFEWDPSTRAAMATAVPHGGLLLTGDLRGTPPDDQPPQVWDSLQAVNDHGDIIATYDKTHLVPFGEYVPLRGILPIDKITPGQMDVSAGPRLATIDLPGLPPVGPLICYEVIFPGEVVDHGPRPQWLFNSGRRPQWLLNLTNDGWYGVSAGPYQHLAAARLRAIEEGLPLVRSAGSGISAIIDPYGRVVESLPLNASGDLDGPLPRAIPDPGLYARCGNRLVLLLLAALASATFAVSRLSPRG